MSRKKDKMKSIPFWVQIVLIIVCGALCSGAVLLIMSEKNKELHTVTFAYSDGAIINSKQVKDGKGVVPEILESNNIFRGWSGAINYIVSDTEVHPLWYKITDNDENLFYFDSVYVKEGRKVKIDLFLSGKVNISAADLSLEYDPEVMVFKEAECESVCSATEDKSGVIKIMLNSGEPIEEKKHLAQLCFKTKKKDVYSTQIEVICKNATLVSGDNEISVVASTLNNKIFFLQEVG